MTLSDTIINLKRSKKHFFNINPYIARQQLKLHKDISKVGLSITNPFNFKYQLGKSDVKWIRAGVGIYGYFLG